MTINDILDISAEDFLKLSEKELRQQTSKLASAANKRLTRLSESGISTPATRAVHSGGGKFSAKGMNFSQLRGEYSRARKFLTSTTSTKKGYQATRKQTIQTLSEHGVDVSADDLDILWETYDRLKEIDPTLEDRRMRYKLLDEISKQFKGGMSADDIVSHLNQRINQVYEEYANEEDEENEWL